MPQHVHLLLLIFTLSLDLIVFEFVVFTLRGLVEFVVPDGGVAVPNHTITIKVIIQLDAIKLHPLLLILLLFRIDDLVALQ